MTDVLLCCKPVGAPAGSVVEDEVAAEEEQEEMKADFGGRNLVEVVAFKRGEFA
jgi:hypothetical protein